MCKCRKGSLNTTLRVVSDLRQWADLLNPECATCYLVKDGEVAVCGKNTGENPVTEVSISNVTSRAIT